MGFWLDRLAPYLNSAGIALYAPRYFDSTGTVRADLATITDGMHVPQWLETLSDSIRWVAARPSVDQRRIGLVGISLGAFLALSLAAQQSNPEHVTAPDPNPVRCIVEISGGLPAPYAEQATARFPPTLILHGENDEIVPVRFAHELDNLLNHLNVAHETRLLPREGHWFSSGAQLQLLLAVSSFLRGYL